MDENAPCFAIYIHKNQVLSSRARGDKEEQSPRPTMNFLALLARATVYTQ